MERELHVYIDIAREPVFVGRLWARDRNGKETATFAYDPGWLKRADSFALSPTLTLGPGPFHSSRGLFTAFSDSAPDRWGRKLMLHNERDRASKAGMQPRTLWDVDFLVGVNDEARLGALRFKDPEEDIFLSQGQNPVPPLIDLRKLLSASARAEKGRLRRGDLARLLDPGSSLGGARPKATVRGKSGQLLIAKFPSHNDDWPVIRWERTTLELAKMAEIEVPECQLESAGGKTILLLDRFDRERVDLRVPVMSALTAVDAKDLEQDHSYLELADVLRQEGASPEQDLRQLWRRMVFNVLVSNTDDHLRNHEFLRREKGWRLSPAYDLNPTPTDIRERRHSLALNEVDKASSIEIALSVAEYFGIEKNDATTITGEVGAAVSKWKEIAKTFKITKAEIGRMASAFDHEDLKMVMTNRIVKAPPKTRKPRTKRTAVKGTKTPRKAAKTSRRNRAASPKPKKTTRTPQKAKKIR